MPFIVPDDSDDDEPTLYIDAGGFVYTTAQEAISASLGFEQISNTGAGCNQSPDNAPDTPDNDDS